VSWNTARQRKSRYDKAYNIMRRALAHALQQFVNENVTIIQTCLKLVLGCERLTSVNAMILCLSPEVREAALDLKALRRKIKEAGERAYEWFPAEANARLRMLCLSLEQPLDEEALSRRQTPPPKPGEGFLKLA
jgi:hypothetical protein